MTEVIGPGRLSDLKDIFEGLSIRSCFLVADPTAYTSSGASERLQPLLDSLDTVTVFSDFAPNPDDTSVEKARRLATESSYDAIVAVGGGTAIDIAKLVSCSLNTPLTQVVADPALIRRDIALIAIPTTAGTGSEATHFAVLYVDGVKHSIAHDRLLPDVCVVDSDLLKSVPASVAAHTGLDALCQSIESLWSIHSTDVSREFASDGLRLSIANLEKVVNHHDPTSRDEMARAAHLSGKAINISKTTASHAISYAMTSEFGIPHGLAVALTMGPMLRWNAAVTHADCLDPRGVEHVYRIVDRIIGLLDVDTPQDAALLFDKTISSIGCSPRLQAFGVSRDQLALLAGKTNVDRLSNNPRKLTEGDILDLLETAF